MTLFTENIFLTDEQEGFKYCRENRTTSSRQTMTVLYCEAGYIDVFYHGAMFRINPGELFVRVPDFSREIGPYSMSPDFAFKQLTVSAPIFDRIMFDHIRMEPNWFAKQEYLKEHPTFQLTEISRDFFYTYFHLFELQMKGEITKYRKEILRQIAKGATMEMLNYLDKLGNVLPSSATHPNTNQSDYTFREFTRLLQAYPHKREVQWYAQELKITPKYLSEICKERSGKSAGQWIADITVSEIKHYLHNSTLPIREIARVMEFPNASFFCQYTKKHTGLTPNHYRKQKEY